MLNTENFIGKKYGKLKIVSLSYKKQKYTKSGRKDGFLYYFNCICECGNYIDVNLHDLTSSHTQSCGCYQKTQVSKKNKIHGLTTSSIFHIWTSMKQRCLNPNNKAYKNYGGRGITICDDWKNNFITFYDWAMNNGYKENLSIDRIDNDGNYQPDNCRWVTRKEQNRNYRKNINVIYENTEYCLKDLSVKLNINYKYLHKKYKKGMKIEDIISAYAKRRT